MSIGPGSIFPAAPSPGNGALPDFGSALLALLGAAAPAAPAMTSGTDLSASATAASKAAPLDEKVREHAGEEKKPACKQEPGLVAAVVPFPLPLPPPVLADCGAPAAGTKAVFGQETAPVAAVVPGLAPVSQPVHVDSPATVEQPGQPELQPSGGRDTARAQNPPTPADPGAAATRPQSNRTDLPHRGAAEQDAPTMDKTLGSVKTEVDPPSPESHPDLRGENPDVQAPATPVLQPPFGQPQPQTSDASPQPVAPTPAPRTELDTALESVKAAVAASLDFAPRPAMESNRDREETPGDPLVSGPTAVSATGQTGSAQAQPKVHDAAAPASLPAVNPPGQAAFEQAGGGQSSHNPPAGKFQPPAVSPSSADHRGGKERVARTSGPGQPKQDALASDAVRANDPAAATDPPPPKVQPAPAGSEAPQPSVPRADVVARSDASDPSPKSDAPAQAPGHNAAASDSPLPADKPSQPTLHSAQLLEKVSQSELRLGMRTGEFGNVEIRTSFDHQQVRAEISSERGDLGRALSTELPGFEQRMREQNVPLSSVVVHDANARAGSGPDRGPRHQQPGPAPDSMIPIGGAKPAVTALPPEAWEAEGILDVRI